MRYKKLKSKKVTNIAAYEKIITASLHYHSFKANQNSHEVKRSYILQENCSAKWRYFITTGAIVECHYCHQGTVFVIGRVLFNRYHRTEIDRQVNRKCRHGLFLLTWSCWRSLFESNSLLPRLIVIFYLEHLISNQRLGTALF